MFFKKYKIKMTGMAGILYLEKGLKVSIGSEMLFGGEYDIVIYLNDYRLWNVEGAVELDDDKAREIAESIKFEFRKSNVDWQ